MEGTRVGDSEGATDGRWLVLGTRVGGAEGGSQPKSHEVSQFELHPESQLSGE